MNETARAVGRLLRRLGDSHTVTGRIDLSDDRGVSAPAHVDFTLHNPWGGLAMRKWIFGLLAVAAVCRYLHRRNHRRKD
jgi:hypothetical protein